MRIVLLWLVCIPFACTSPEKKASTSTVLLGVRVSSIDTNKNVATAIVIKSPPQENDSSYPLSQGKTIQITKIKQQKLQIGKTYTARLRRDGTFNPYGYTPVDANSFVALF
ncbi:MAG: hypothetical protein AAF518_08490 [Spirochaetota bacterium]